MDATDVGFIIMDIYFNELSCYNLTEDSIDSLISDFSLLVKSAHDEGVKKVRFGRSLYDILLFNNLSFGRYCHLHQKNQFVKALLATCSYPYITDEEENLANTSIQKKSFFIEIGGCRYDSEGLACAFLANSIGIGFHSANWAPLLYELIVCEDNSEERVTVLCISHQSHLSDIHFESWADQKLPPPVLTCSNLTYSNKQIHISKHHGRNVLLAFAKRLIHDPYIEEIVNSIDIVPGASKFISSYHDDIIEVRLVRDGGFGLALRTTARSNRELRAIALHLEDTYYH